MVTLTFIHCHYDLNIHDVHFASSDFCANVWRPKRFFGAGIYWTSDFVQRYQRSTYAGYSLA